MDRQIQGTDRQNSMNRGMKSWFSTKFTKNKQKQNTVVIIAAMIEGKDSTNNRNKDDKDKNSRRITNVIYLSTLPLFNM